MNPSFSKTTSFLISLLILTTMTSAMIIQPRILGKEKRPDLSAFGSTSFLATMIIKKLLSENKMGFDPETYNELFYGVINNNRSKELELFIIFMKTFQKDFSNKCKMAMLKNIENLQTNGDKKFFMVRCEFISEVVFKYLHMSILFFNLEYVFKVIKQMIGSDTILMTFDEENSLQGKTRNLKFFNVLEEVISKAVDDEAQNNWLANRFEMINNFYGPHFMMIFSGLIDEDFMLHRHVIKLNQDQRQMKDLAFNVPQNIVDAEEIRIAQQRVLGGVDFDVYGVGYKNLYRFYGQNFETPVYDVNEFHLG